MTSRPILVILAKMPKSLSMKERIDRAILEPWKRDFEREGIDSALLARIHKQELNADEPKYLKIKKNEFDPIKMGKAFLREIGRGAEIVCETGAEILLRIPEKDWAQKVNVNGSGISLGHPIGATGTMRLATLVHEMARRGSKYGLEAICGGGGLGICAIVRRGVA